MKIEKAPSGSYVARIETPHGRRTIKLRTSNYVEACRIASETNIRQVEAITKTGKVRNELLAQVILGRRLTLQEAIGEHSEWFATRTTPKTAQNVRRILKAWELAMGISDCPTHELAAYMVDKHVNREDGCKASSKAQKLNAIRGFLEWCLRRHYVIRNPADELLVRRDRLTHEQQEPERTLPFSQDEFDLILKAYIVEISCLESDLEKPGLHGSVKAKIASRLYRLRFWRLAVETSWETGLRLGDICQLERSSVAEPGKLVVHTGKTGSRVEIRIRPSLQSRLRASSEGESLFPREASEYADVNRRAALSKEFSRFVQKLGIEGRSFHSLRSSNASNSNRIGIPLERIRRNLGHSNATTTLGYIS